MDLRAAFVGVTHVTLTWKTDNITGTCRMLLEGSQELTTNLTVNIFDLKPGSQHTVTLYPLGLTGLISLLSKGLSRIFSNTTVQRHQFFCTQLSQKKEMQKCKMFV